MDQDGPRFRRKSIRRWYPWPPGRESPSTYCVCTVKAVSGPSGESLSAVVPKMCTQNLLEFWSQDRWHYPNDASVSDARITWQELVFDFIGEFGVVKGLLEPHTRLSLLTRRFRDHSVKLLAAAGAPAKGFTNISHLKCFTGGSAAGICARRNFSCPHIVWGFLLSRCSSHASRNALARSRPNAHFTPSWEFLPK